MVPLPVQVPVADVSVWVSRGVPETVGRAVLTGALGVATAVCADTAVADPLALVAVTAARSVWPTSAAATT